MLKRLILVLILLALIFGGIFYWKQRQQQQTAVRMSQPPPPAVVAVTQVKSERWQPRLRAVGTVSAIQGISVTNEVAGMVREILFESGQSVSQGDRLVQLDDSVDKAELRGLIAERDLAAIKFRRLAKLLKERSISQSDYDEAKAQLESAEARVATKRAVIGKKAVRAPFDGMLGIRMADIGDYLPPGSPIVPLQALDPIYVDFSLPERHFARIRTGQPIRVTLAAQPGRVFDGRISAINPGVEEATRSIRLRATLANPQQRLRPGMFAEVEVLLPGREGVLTIPRVAVTYTPYGDSVFLLEEAGDELKVQRRQIETGDARGQTVEVLEGLDVGERVVLAGQVKLRNGQAVRIDNSVVPEGEVTTP
jgi:membrane fusion protein (multidrug efflux system)